METNSEKAENLRFLIDQHRAEVQHHENYISEVFNWTLTIMLALVGAYVGLVSSEVWSKHGDWHLAFKVVFLGMQSALAVMTVIGMKGRVDAINANARIVAAASQALGLFNKHEYITEDFVYPQEWRHWGDPERRATKIIPRYNTAILSTILTLSLFIIIALE